ncbi:serendipity locus protein delta-like [Anoplophora glabripennis]|uniref:serendipity locus protein delta-like n=1 Tax=Anoplophora glabripennis TaxID=217634 RepID=UPI000C768DEC|nr:serendipity locus protein delta-like [Anoplophora glabripennis]
MTGVYEISCRLCLKTVTVQNFEVIENVIRYVLDVLLLKLKFHDESKEVICNACRRKLYAAFEFKSTCLNTDNTIIPHVDCENMLQIDIREVYRKEERSESISDSQKICRLCMNLVKSEFMCIREEELEAIQKLTPEMNINIIKDPVVCKECFDSLCTHNSFLRECLEVEEKIRGVYDNSATESRIDTSPSDLFVTTENLDRDSDISEMEFSIETECVDIESEDEERSDAPLQTYNNNEPSEKSDCKVAEEDGCKNENGSENKCNTKTKQECKVLYKCDKSVCQTGCKSHFTTHCARHENNSEEYKRESCEYETEIKKLLQSRLRHKGPSQIKMYKCKDCNYEAKYRSDMKRHQLKHKDPSQIKMYKCNYCDFETRYRKGIKRHKLQHKNSSQIQMYRSDSSIYWLIPSPGNVCCFADSWVYHFLQAMLSGLVKIHQIW